MPVQTVSDSEQYTSLQWLMKDFVERVPGAHSATLSSAEGMRKASAGILDEAGADRMCAVMSGLYSLAKGASRLQQQPSKAGPKQVVAELDSGFLFVMSGGEGSLLAVQAGADADPGVIGNEMSLLVASVKPHLVTPVREREEPVGVGQ
ncbi:roadblock/LC7 domain-containing protein [Streptomyces sp. NPDC006923]|uniref:roadblock/LC7 domain-containing protein n=1 Tax=Streptomyces sp. NPDC006923 TaxID=3155355 RepID=UPI003406D3AE